MPITYQQTKLRGYLRLKIYSVKYINSDVKKLLKNLIEIYCQSRCELLSIWVGDEEVEMIFDYALSSSISQLIRGLKSSTSRQIRESFPDTLGKEKSFWVDTRNRHNLRKNYVFVSLNPYQNPPLLGEGEM